VNGDHLLSFVVVRSSMGEVIGTNTGQPRTGNDVKKTLKGKKLKKARSLKEKDVWGKGQKTPMVKKPEKKLIRKRQHIALEKFQNSGQFGYQPKSLMGQQSRFNEYLVGKI